jgi:hypothetical protein
MTSEHDLELSAKRLQFVQQAVSAVPGFVVCPSAQWMGAEWQGFQAIYVLAYTQAVSNLKAVDARRWWKSFTITN